MIALNVCFVEELFSFGILNAWSNMTRNIKIPEDNFIVRRLIFQSLGDYNLFFLYVGQPCFS